ncbi:hypothetical protein RJ55_02587 [Drechmeria coniospora]|nr:hypothetical protein RJ55_02587 [Drechmeria coniospora]
MLQGQDFHRRSSQDFHCRSSQDFHHRSSQDFHPRSSQDFHLRSSRDFHPRSSRDFHPRSSRSSEAEEYRQCSELAAPECYPRDFTKEKKISMSFQINSEGYEPEWCFLQVNVTREAKDASFYKPCDPGGNFSVSWSIVGGTTGSMVLW